MNPATIKLLIGATILLAVASCSGAAGWKVAAWRCEANEAQRQREDAAESKAALEAVRNVSAAYQNVLAELRRIESVNRVEVNRETVRTEYRCALPSTGGVLLDRAVDAANAAVARSAATLPADRQAPNR